MGVNVTKFDIFKNSRLVLGLALFIIAITSASLITKEANRSVLVWASTGELAPGQIIEQSDVATASVLLAQSAKNYLSANAQIIGTTVLTNIAGGDLIPAAALGAGIDSTNQRLLPITVEVSDLPIALSRGDVVDLYAVKKGNMQVEFNPALLATGVSVDQVLERNNSGVVSVLVILNNDQILPILTYIAESRLILVRTR
jgi:flagella basal body P-ring formation protein FlgA